MAKVMTYAQAIDVALGLMADGEAKERLVALKEQLAKRNASTGERKPTKAQRDNEVLKGHILELLVAEPDGMTPTEVASAMHVVVQKVTPQLTALVTEGKAVKVPKGKKNLYFAVENAPAPKAEVVDEVAE